MTALVADDLVELAVELGIGRQADAGIWDASAFDAAVWAQTDTDLGDWVDVACSVVDDTLALAAGSSSADGVVTRWEAATAVLTLVGEQWSPWTGPYAGVLGAGVGVRVRWRLAAAGPAAPWSTAFTGAVTPDGYTWAVNHARPARSLAAIAAVDDTAALVAYDGPEQAPAGAGETSATRIGRVLDNARWPGADRDITPGGVTLQATTLAGAAWTELLLIADTDLALLWVRRDGRLAFRPEGHLRPAAASAALAICPGPGLVAVVDVLGGQPAIIRNAVTIARVGGAEVTVLDEASISRYRAKTYGRADLIHTDEAWSPTIAAAILAGAAFPSAAPVAVALDSRADVAAVALLLAGEPDQAWTFTDGVKTWTLAPAGWSVTLSRRAIAGQVTVTDVTRWAGALWDVGTWDTGTFGF